MEKTPGVSGFFLPKLQGLNVNKWVFTCNIRIVFSLSLAAIAGRSIETLSLNHFPVTHDPEKIHAEDQLWKLQI